MRSLFSYPERYQAFYILFLLFVNPLQSIAQLPPDAIISRMNQAYSTVINYQADVEVRLYRQNDPVDTKNFLYTFKKPNHIRLDFETPHRGMVLIYPDIDSRVEVRPFAWLHFFWFHLDPDNALLRGFQGQRIDQTDLGLLIRNITRSLSRERLGPVDISQDGSLININVLAVNHFKKDVRTLYTFGIDEKLWLPVRVTEKTPDGTLQQTIVFRNLRINVDLPKDYFLINKT
jgi:hypothetical protein